MILKHSIKSIIRTPKKTTLFLVLIIALTILLCIGISMYDSSLNMLSDADKTFTTIVELDYLGDAGGDEVGFYKNMNQDLADYDFDLLENHPYVKTVDKENDAWAYIEGESIKRIDTPLVNYAIIKIGSIVTDDKDLSQGIVNEVFFGQKARDDAYIKINNVNEQGMHIGYEFNYDHEYLIIGQISIGRTATFTLTPGLPKPAADLPYIIDLTENPDYLLTEGGKKILDLREAMSVVDNSLQVTTITSLEASAPYYFNEILLKEGRIFSSADYQLHQNVILISEAVASFYQVKLGDQLSLKLHYNSNGIDHSEFLLNNQFANEAAYEIVGIFENKDVNEHTIYMPKTPWLKQEFHSTTLARYMIKNGCGEEYIKENVDNLLPNMKFKISDQGYGEAVKPIIAMKNSAVLIIVLGVLSGIAILFLYSYLYVIKQKDTLKTMLSLGTGKRRTINYILYGAISLVLVASSIGAIISSQFLNRVTKIIFEAMRDTYETDLRYSERSIGLQMNFIPEVKVNQWLPILVIILIFVISVLLLLLFTYRILQEDKQVILQKKSKIVRSLTPRIRKVKRLLFQSVKPITLKFALISLSRSPGRSLIIPFISIILAIFILFLGLLSSKQQEKLDTVYDRIPVTAYMTTLKNETRDIGALNLYKDIYPLMDVDFAENNQRIKAWLSPASPKDQRDKTIDGSNYFGNMLLYSAIHYEYMGISMTKEGEVDEELSQLPNIRMHSNSNGFDWFLNSMKKMPKLAYADDIRYTPGFFDHTEPEVEFLEGYNFESFCQDDNIGIISRSFAKENSIDIGDSIRLTAWANYDMNAVCCVLNFRVVGIYDAKWISDTIYIPWTTNYQHFFIEDMRYPMETNTTVIWAEYNELIPKSVRAVTFTLNNTNDLTSFRDYLESEGYSQVGKMNDKRRVIVIEDKRLIETIQSLKNHIRLLDIMKPIMLILFGIIGFIVSYLLIKHRVNEFAIMRSMGAKKRQVFFSFFLEQLILFMIGLTPIAAYAIIQPQKIPLYGLSLIFFILCYSIGTSMALLVMNRAKILDVLSAKE